MAGLDELLSCFSLTEEEKGAVEVPKQEVEQIYRLAGKFFTKQILNVNAMARTFKPLWKPIRELKIRDIGENILLFEFEDQLDLERVLEFEPLSYDKHLVAFQKATDFEPVPFLDYSCTTFWLQIHNVPEKSLTTKTGEAIGNSLGSVIQVADSEDDGSGGEFLRVRVKIDISKPLPRYCKLCAEGKQIS